MSFRIPRFAVAHGDAWFDGFTIEKLDSWDGTILPFSSTENKTDDGGEDDPNGSALLIVIACVLALMHNGGFFDEGEYYHDLSGAFGNTDATVGLPIGAGIALIVIVIYLLIRRLVSFKDAMKAVPKGFVAMVADIFDRK